VGREMFASKSPIVHVKFVFMHETASPTLGKLTGLVLCGGQSSRMGMDKGLLKHQTQVWAEVAFHKAADLGIPVYVSIHSSQLSAYTGIFPDHLLLTDTIPIRGPLAGVLTAHAAFPETDWLVLACDLRDMTREVLHLLTQHYRQATAYEYLIFEKDGEPEPLCAIYRSAGLQKMMHRFRQQMLSKFSMKYILAMSVTQVIQLDELMHPAFKNYNSPDDLS